MAFFQPPFDDFWRYPSPSIYGSDPHLLRDLQSTPPRPRTRKISVDLPSRLAVGRPWSRAARNRRLSRPLSVGWLRSVGNSVRPELVEG
jgi:hypothetical protein